MSTANTNEPRRRFIEWSSKLDAGTCMLILTVLGGIYHFGGKVSAIEAEQVNMKTANVAEVQRSKETIADMKLSVGVLDSKLTSMNDKLGAMAVTMAEIRATQQQRVSK